MNVKRNEYIMYFYRATIVSGLPFHHALFGGSASEISLNALKHCRRRKARTVFSDPQLTGEKLHI